MSQTLSSADVSAHNKPNDLWIIVDDDVYDLSQFQEEHPGGKKSKHRFTHNRRAADALTRDAQSCRE